MDNVPCDGSNAAPGKANAAAPAKDATQVCVGPDNSNGKDEGNDGDGEQARLKRRRLIEQKPFPHQDQAAATAPGAGSENRMTSGVSHEMNATADVKREDDHDLSSKDAKTEVQCMPGDVSLPTNSLPTLDEAVDAGVALAEPWGFVAVLELLTCAVLQNGAKTPTHMNKMLDGHQQVFSKLCPMNVEEKHVCSITIASCVFKFWATSSQRLEITIDTLLHRGVLTPRAVVEHALAERGPQGCDSMAVRNIIHNVARRSLEHSQSVRAELAIAKRLGKADILDQCRQQLDAAIHETAELFTIIFTGLVRNHQDFEDTDTFMRHVMLQRILTIGRKYHIFIKPLIDTAESRIPGVAHNPDIAAIFHSLSTM